MKTLVGFLVLSLYSAFVHAAVPAIEVPLSAAARGRAPGVQEFPRIAVSDSGGFVAWQDYRGNGDVYGTRIDREGRPLDPLGIRVSATRLGPAGVTAFGDDYVVALTTPCDAIAVVYVTSDGVVSPEKLIGSSNGLCVGTVGMASNGRTALVAWPRGEAVLLDRDGEVVTRLALGPADAVAAATNGTDYLVATLTRIGTSKELAVQRVSGTGTAGERHVIGSVDDIAAVAVASNGSDYIIASTGTSLRTQIIAADGIPAGPPELVAIDRGTTAMDAAWDGGEYIVGFAQFDHASSKYAIFAARYDRNGRRTTAASVATVTQNVPFRNFSLASSAGFGSFLTWADDREVFVGRISGGNVTPVLLSVSASSQNAPLITRTGDQLVAVWREYSPERESLVIRAAILGGDLLARGEPREIAVIADGPHHVVANDTAIVITWTRHFSGPTLYAQRFTHDLEPIDPAPVVISSQPRHPHAVAVSDHYALIVWGERGTGVLYASALPTGAAIPPSAPIALPDLPFDAHTPAAAWNGREFLVAWAQARGFPPSQGLYPDPPDDLLMVRVSMFGTLIDSAPLTIESSSHHIGSISLVSNGDGDAWIGWRSRNGFMGRRIDADGTPVGQAVTLLGRNADVDAPMLVAGGDRYLVAWDARTGVYHRRVGIRPIIGDSVGAAVLLPEREISWGAFSVAAGDFGIVAAYDRIAPEAPYGGTSRVFVRGVSQTQPRRRAVAGRSADN